MSPLFYKVVVRSNHGDKLTTVWCSGNLDVNELMANLVRVQEQVEKDRRQDIIDEVSWPCGDDILIDVCGLERA